MAILKKKKYMMDANGRAVPIGDRFGGGVQGGPGLPRPLEVDPDDDTGLGDEEPEFFGEEEEDVLPLDDDIGPPPPIGAGNQTVREYGGKLISPNNPAGDAPLDDASWAAAMRWEGNQGTLKAPTKPPTPRAGPAPLNRIPAGSLSPNNPYAGIDDQLARAWEQKQMAGKSGSGGGALGLLQFLRGGSDGTKPNLPGQIGGGGTGPGYEALAGKRPDVVDFYAQNGWDKANLKGIFQDWWAKKPKDDAASTSKSLEEYAGQSLGSVGTGSRFTSTPMAATAGDALSNIKGYGDVGDIEGQYYLPFFNDELGGTPRASRNLMSSIGLNPNIGNPYTDFMTEQAGEMAYPSLIRRALAGEVPDERAIASDIATNLSSGSKSPLTSQELRASLSALRGRDDLTPIQGAVLDLLQNDPSFLTGLQETSVPRNLRSSFRKSRRNSTEQFMNRAPSMTNMGLSDWLLQ